jgi:hypothetical protein
MGLFPRPQVSATLSAKVQNVGAIDSPSCPLFGARIEAAGGAGAVTLPSSLKDAVLSDAGDAVVLWLVSVAVSPHSPNATHTNTIAARPGSAVLSIAMESASSSKPLVVEVICPTATLLANHTVHASHHSDAAVGGRACRGWRSRSSSRCR